MKTLMMEIFFNLKSIQTHLPKSRTQKEEKPKGAGSDQNPLKKFKKRNLKEVHRSNHVLNVKTKYEVMSLVITTVPDKYFKDLTPRESKEDSSVDFWERWMMEQENSGDEKDNDAIIHFFEKKTLS
jgi:hypothetical protein